MSVLHELTVTLNVDAPIPTEDGAVVVGRVEFASRCTASGHAITCCRRAGEQAWHRVNGAEADLEDPAQLPFHHSTVITSTGARTDRSAPSQAKDRAVR
ncbi:MULTISPECIES: hypothetical protein [Tsukamurella]|uniref:Uncharacterized protein n=2 Tax=Tsukamurella TaxID=2060 RepID=A0A5C5S7P6_9ACTN|nr:MULTISPECIES: hypothetical protein [Tsukamurella]NMD55671.1 hypothetical protein [Tsukamurella columbiensis]TWS30371.1 hypothetical protein FK530_00345 [Tsukamurella conjunctivitidis]